MEVNDIMAKFFDSISDEFAEWIAKQHLFFVASAPLSAEGHVNMSPKGRDSLRVLSPNCVAYVDMTGSGNETSAHLKENGRMTFMFCSFETTPRIIRLFAKGRVVLPNDAEWDSLAANFTILSGTRQIVVGDVYSVQTSCGFAVPFMEYVGERDTLEKWAETKGEDGLAAYHAEKNFLSLDGLPTHLCGE
jgi:hypothetical protein